MKIPGCLEVVQRLTCQKGKPRAFLAWLTLLLLLAAELNAGTITGQIQPATGGVIANGTLTFTLSQPAVLAGTALLTQASASCYTSNADPLNHSLDANSARVRPGTSS